MFLFWFAMVSEDTSNNEEDTDTSLVEDQTTAKDE